MEDHGARHAANPRTFTKTIRSFLILLTANSQNHSKCVICVAADLDTTVDNMLLLLSTDLFRGMRAWRKTMEPQKPKNSPGSGPEVAERQRVAKE